MRKTAQHSKKIMVHRYVADFETTVYDGQIHTEVWAAAIAPVDEYLETKEYDVKVTNSIDAFWEDITERIIGKYAEEPEYDHRFEIYFHNLKFDGCFLMYFFLQNGFTNALDDCDKFKPIQDMQNGELTYLISDMGQWYEICVKTHDVIVTFKDSLKLLPFSVKQIGEGFRTKHRKTEIEYQGERHADGEIKKQEIEYIKNDVLVVCEALREMFRRGHTAPTIGSCCLKEFKKGFGYLAYNSHFPDVYQQEIHNDGAALLEQLQKCSSMEIPDLDLDPEHDFGALTVGDWIRNAYRGGWCHVVPEKTNRVFTHGLTLDVNSLYPSVMHSDLDFKYPFGYGIPIAPKDNKIPSFIQKDGFFYYVRFTCRFYLRPGYLPFIQIKNNPWYPPTVNLCTSDIWIRETGKYHKVIDGRETTVTMTMTETDWELFNTHYHVRDLTIHDIVYFSAGKGFFDKYIEKYRDLKINAETPAERMLAKLFINNLYGQMARSTRSDYKIAHIENNLLVFDSVVANDKKPGYIPAGAAITSYARFFTISAAQKNYYGKDASGYIYSDTDSLHIDLDESELQGVKLHDKNFGCWKIESKWDKGLFVRQKTYIEQTGNEYDIKCAGMPRRCKEYLIERFNQGEPLTIFKKGLCVPGKLIPRIFPGGVVLQEVNYEMR